MNPKTEKVLKEVRPEGEVAKKIVTNDLWKKYCEKAQEKRS